MRRQQQDHKKGYIPMYVVVSCKTEKKGKEGISFMIWDNTFKLSQAGLENVWLLVND